jgi:hypothetical protein
MKIRSKQLNITILVVLTLIIYTVVYISIQHHITINKLKVLYSIDDKTLSRDELRKKIPKGLSELNNNKEIAFFTKFMDISNSEDAVLYKINGKGIPNYYGVIVFDTVKNHVKKLYIHELK